MPASTNLARPEWALDPAEVAARAGRFITDILNHSGQDGLVVGLSGGIDSAVAAGLAVRTLGPDRVHAIRLPYRTSSEASLRDAQAVAEALGLAPDTVDITPVVDAFLARVPDADPIRRGNVMARVRMLTLFDASQARRALVLGTGNRTEWLLGYTTLHGDAACGLNPVAQLYKTEIRLLAQHLGLPAAVITKAPSADLWAGQSDEDELGFTYAEADRLLHHMVDEGLAPRQLASLGFAPELVERVAARMRSQAFKRLLPPVCSFGRPSPDAA
ncbi:MAG: NAD+ synthase [Candidatus Krumholzibacteriia bacterium]